MNKFIHVFQRSKPKEERRTQQFVRRHSTRELSDYYSAENTTPHISESELSEIEREAYESWWTDLDPFDYQTLDNQTILKFLSGCDLAENKLEDIVALFDTAKDGLNKFQFYAMLRLIAHAQNGRKISPALVYLGAPLPHFNTKPERHSPSSEEEEELDMPDLYHRKSWWGTDTQTSINHDYMHDSHYNTYNEDKYSHSRSKSAGTYSMPTLQPSRSSFSLNDNTGKSLLLTQKFVYESPSIRNRTLNNPFSHDPFEEPIDINTKENSLHLPPPPVPSQSTKPAYPKYTRTNNYILKRNQSNPSTDTAYDLFT